MPDQREPEQGRVGQESLDDRHIAHPQVTQPGVAIGVSGGVEQRGRSETLDEPPQLARRDRSLAKVDERDWRPTLLEEALRGAGVLVALETKDLDRWAGGRD